jgi:hypothetical protein
VSEHPPYGDRSEPALYRSSIGASEATTTARERLAAIRPAVATVCVAATGGALAFLAIRLQSDVGTKPYFEDEAVAGLIASRPLPEVIHTVLWERGGSPLHFVLAHFVLWAWPSVGALRWLSVACALGVVVCAYALGRELAGDVAGAVAAWIAATSALLHVYGTFGRMYSLLALVGGLNMLLFLRALDRPTYLRVSLAAASAWLLAAAHPFGGIPVALEAVIAAWLWHGRGLRRALPVLVAAVATAPLAIAELRLALRFDVSASSGTPLGSGGNAGTQLEAAARGFAGGGSVAFWLFLALALVGAAFVARRSVPMALVGAGALLLPPALSLVARVHDTTTAFLSARHLMLSLPLWAALIGTGTVRVASWSRARGVAAPLVAAAAVALVAVVAPASARDPRTHFVFLAEAGDVDASAPVGAFLARSVEPGDLLFPYSVPYLRALRTTRHGRPLPRGEPGTLLAAIDDAGTARRLWIAVPLGAAEKPLPGPLRALRRTRVVRVFSRWLIVGARPPLAGRRQILRSLLATVDATAAALPRSDTVHQYQDIARRALARSR